MQTKKKTANFKVFRITVLLFILALVWKHFDNQKKIVQNWQGTHDVVITPINFDGASSTQAGINKLSNEQFKEIDDYLNKQAKQYAINLGSSIQVRLGNTINSLPPKLPNIGASRWDVVLWSLKLRWWAWQNKTLDSHASQINLYVMYSSPKPNQRLPHSTGLQKGLIGLIHANANPKSRKRNNMIITHELLHIFGASDKYDLRNGRPLFPEGYANPNQSILFPQRKAEIMAGRIPTSETRFARVFGLSQTVIGKKTAQEIGWIAQIEHEKAATN